jgi:hypothetical protein
MYMLFICVHMCNVDNLPHNYKLIITDVCIHALIHWHLLTHVGIIMHLYIRACSHIHMYIHALIHWHLLTHVGIIMHLYIRACSHIHMYIHALIHWHLLTHVVIVIHPNRLTLCRTQWVDLRDRQQGVLYELARTW